MEDCKYVLTSSTAVGLAGSAVSGGKAGEESGKGDSEETHFGDVLSLLSLG
jgi:hypothetical protein